MTGPPTFTSLPKKWWPQHWQNFKDPVCRLDKALYGHPKAGDIWGAALAEHLKARGFSPVEGWPSVFCKDLADNGIMVVVAYVDDLLFLGTNGMSKEISALRELVQMEDPEPLAKYLGCNHRITKKTVGKDVETNVALDMCDYFKQACEVYVGKTGLALKAVDSPYVPDLPTGQMDKLPAEPGKFGEHAASLLMKLLYGCRMAAPWLSVGIQRLARQVHKWNAECDRRMHRLYCYVLGSVDLVLEGVLSTIDIDSLTQRMG
jgi:hypothetical protein